MTNVDGFIDAMHEALVLQQIQCTSLGSSLYGELLLGIIGDYVAAGTTRRLLEGRFERPVHDAAPLRLLGAVHRLALSGRAPDVARHYPSCGGTPGSDPIRDVLAAIDEFSEEIVVALSQQVQTNEVGRSVVHLSIAQWLVARGVPVYDHLEVGASAGLNMNFDHFFADTGAGTMGDPDSSLRFAPSWFDVAPPVTTPPATVRDRRGCDTFPIDANDPDQALRLLSFVWPDQSERFVRTREAIAIARSHPPLVDTASADEWVRIQLSGGISAATVVFHSIVWQYLGRRVQDGLREALNEAGAVATRECPLYWIRMEPAGPVANVRATEWSGNEPVETLLCEIGYHGRDMRWLA